MKRILLFTATISFVTLFSITSCKKHDDDKKLPVLTTSEVTDIAHNSAISGGTIIDDGGSTITERGVCWSTSQNPTVNDNKTSDGTGAGSFTSSITGLKPETTYYMRAYATNANGIGYGSAMPFTTKDQEVNWKPCPGIPTITDVDGNVYNTVLMGSQCWMKDNLKTTHYRNGTPIEYPVDDNTSWQNNTTGAFAWYDNDISWKDSYGALYNWYAVNNINGLCPTGWRVPSDDEWTQLVDFAVAQGFSNQWDNPYGIGNALKSCRQVNSPLGGNCNTTAHPRWNGNAIHQGFDEFGFVALPGGNRSPNGSIDHIGDRGYWWSSTENSYSGAWRRHMSYSGGYVSRGYFDKTFGFSVRCLSD